MASHAANTNLRDKGGNHNDHMVWKQGSFQHSSCLQEQHQYMKADLCQIQEKIGRRRPEGAGIEEGKPESTTAG